jgi:PmbA protein
MKENAHSANRSVPQETAELVRRIIESLRKKAVDGFELYIDRSSHFGVESKEGRVDTFEVSHTSGLALRVLKDHRMGFSYATSLPLNGSGKGGFTTEISISRVVDDAIAGSQATSPDPCYDFAPPLTDLPSPLPIFDGDLAGVPEKSKIQMAVLLEEAVRAVDPKRIRKVRKASYQDGLSRRTLLNSNGLEFSYEVSVCSASVSAVAEESGESEVGWEFDASHFFKDLDIHRVGLAAGREALNRLGGKRIPSGFYPVLLGNRPASEFLSLLSHSFLSEQVQKGKSSLRDKMGEIFFSPDLSIVDDGLLREGISTTPVDGEGMPSLRTPLVTDGRISGFLYTRYWANREKFASSASQARSTGNSRRPGVKGPPEMGVSNLFVSPGRISFRSLLEGLDRGVVVEEVMGLHTVDPISGDFSLGCSGQWVEKGRGVHPVKSITVAGNLFELFRKVIGVGEDLRFFGGVGSPSLLIEGLTIGGE